MALHRMKIGNGIYNEVLVNVLNMFKKKIPGEGNSFSAEDIDLQSAPVPSVNPKTIPKIPEEDQVLEDKEVQGEIPEANEVQDLEHLDFELPAANEVQDLEHLDSELPAANEVQDLEHLDSELPAANEVQDLEHLDSELPAANEVQDLEHLDSELLQDGDLPNAVIYKSTKLFFDEGIQQWVAEPHVRVWSKRPRVVV